MLSDHRQIGLFSATMIVAASMIGVGVFTTSGFALSILGSPGRVMAAWAVGSVIALCGAVSYAALASKFAQSGGEYLFLARAIHPAAGVTAGWVSLLAGFTGPIAAAAIGLEGYAAPLLELPLLGSAAETLPRGAIAIAAIVSAAALHTIHVAGATRIQNLMVMGKLSLIGMFIAYACTQGTVITSGIFDPVLSLPPFSVTAFAEQLVWISFSFAGFNAAIYVASEVDDPTRNVPRALIGGTFLVSMIYLLLNAIFVGAAPMSVLISEENRAEIAATAAMAMGGERLMMLVRGVIAIALMTSISAMVMTGPRIYAKMAEDGFLPRFFAWDSSTTRSRPPTVAIWFQAALAIGLVTVSRLQDLLSYLGLTLSLCSSLAIASLFVLRARGQIDRLPGFGIPPLIFILATIILGGLASWEKPYASMAAVASVAIGAVLYPLMKSKHEDEECGSGGIDSCSH